MPWPPLSMAISSCTGVLPGMLVCFTEFSLQRQANEPESRSGSSCDSCARCVTWGAAFAQDASSCRGAHAHRMQYRQAAQRAAVCVMTTEVGAAHHGLL